MKELRTNRDLYLAIVALCRRQTAEEGSSRKQRSLEHYLLAMLALAKPYQAAESIAIADFFALLADAFDAEPIPFDRSWLRDYDRFDIHALGFAGWQAQVLRQIVDLREMAEAGTLNDEWRYFGINAPRGARWYNFDPCAYLECAMAGAFRGWEPGDEGGRDFVPGPVIVLEEDGSLGSADPEDLERPIYPLPAIDWAQFSEFIGCGQYYE